MGDLSKSMKITLRDAISSSTAVGTAGTLAALRSRGLIDEFAKLTVLGQISALEQVSLKAQCEELGLELRDLAVEDLSEPEIAAWKHFRQEGYQGSWCEGGAILTLLKAMCLDTLARVNTFGSRDDACTRYLEAQFTIHAALREDLHSAIRSATPRLIEANFNEIYSHVFVRDVYPGLEVDFILALYERLGTSSLVDVATTFLQDPYQFRKGWPDLTLVDHDSAMFVEVKVRDKLHRSQLITIPAMRRVLPAEFFVVRCHALAGK